MTESPEPGAQSTDNGLIDHEYDGIQEFDNPMPRWWVWTFWATFFFSVGYIFHFWIGNGIDELESYEAEMAVVRAEEARRALAQAPSEEMLTRVSADESSLKAGAEIFATRCAPCHAAQGQGLIGPNLTDSAWIHGKGSLLDIYHTVGDGVLDKGMPAWSRQLTPAELGQVVAFVGSIRHQNVAGKPAEGTVVP